MNPKPTDHQVGGDHYRSMDIQPIDYMRAVLTPEQFVGFCRGNALKYLSRMGAKGPARQDVEKARHYLDFMLEAME